MKYLLIVIMLMGCRDARRPVRPLILVANSTSAVSYDCQIRPDGDTIWFDRDGWLDSVTIGGERFTNPHTRWLNDGPRDFEPRHYGCTVRRGLSYNPNSRLYIIADTVFIPSTWVR